MSERARTCMTVAAKAEADGDGKLAELGWLQALSLMNYMAEDIADHDGAAADDERIFSNYAVGSTN